MVKLKSSTILEVIMALLIGTMIIGFSMNIVVKTGKNYNAVKRAGAMFMLKNRISIIQEEPNQLQDTIRGNGIFIVEKMTAYQQSEKVFVLELKAYTLENRFLVEKKALIEINNNDED